MGGINTVLQSNNTTRVARANYRRAKANTDNTNRSQMAESSFSDFMRSLKNNAQLEGASKEYNFQMEQLSEELRAKGASNLNTQLQLSTARGALSAQAGAVGVGGSSSDLMDTMVRLQAELDQETQDNALKLMASRGGQQSAQVMANAAKGMDLSRTFGQFDYSQYIEPVAMKRRFGKAVGLGFAYFFGYGEAASQHAIGTWQADNGNFEGASQSFGNAAGSALQSYKTNSANGGAGGLWGMIVNRNNGNQSTSSSTGAKVTQLGNNYDNFTTSTSGLGWFNGNNTGGAW